MFVDQRINDLSYWKITFFKLRTLTSNIDLLISRPKIKNTILLQDNKGGPLV